MIWPAVYAACLWGEAESHHKRLRMVSEQAECLRSRRQQGRMNAMAHHITSSRATAMMVNTAERGLVRVRETRNRRGVPRGGVGGGGRPADQSKVPWELGALRQLDEGHIDDGRDSHGDAPAVSNFGLAVRKSSPTACTNNQSAGHGGLPRNDQAALQAHSFSRPCCTADV